MTRTAFQEKLQRATDRIVQQFHPERVILFGSWAWGTPGPDSDVDLLVIKATDNTRRTAREIDSALFPREFPIDLIVYSPAQIEQQTKQDFFIRAILANGQVLYEK